MTKEDKNLLLKDLCARTPYNVKCKVYLDTKGYCLRDEDKYCDDTLESVNCRKQTCTFNKSIGYNFGNFAIEDVRPYLRPLSSMTEDEKKYIEDKCGFTIMGPIGGEFGLIMPVFAAEWLIEFYNSRHLDYRGLIPMGLALEAPEGMYKID